MSVNYTTISPFPNKQTPNETVVLVKEVHASGQLTEICHTTADDIVLSFSMQSVCVLLINVVFLTFSTSSFCINLVCSNLFELLSASIY